MDEDVQREIKKRISEIERKSADGNYIYRGEPETHEEHPFCGKVSSNLLRDFGIETEGFNIEVIQMEMLEGAKKHIGELPQNLSGEPTGFLNVIQVDDPIDFEILTEIQHYGGKTNLIDFTTDYFIALFFACDGHYDKDGRVILQKTEEIQNMIAYPRNPRHRVIAQKSVFVRPPKGFINKPHEDNVVIIPKSLKQWVRQHLQQYHGISKETIYNDVHGFIRYQGIHGEAYTFFYRGLAFQKKGDEAKDSEEKQREYKESVEHYTQAIQHNPNLVEAYNNLGIVYRNKADYNEAIKNFDCAINLNPNDAVAYNNLGLVYQDKADYNEAIKNFDRAIDLDPHSDIAYYNRGLAYTKKGIYEEAIVNYTQAIQLNPGLAQAYNNRGEALLHMEEWEKAKSDLITAGEKGANIINVFRNDYESIEAFEQKYGIRLPPDIEAMLTPTQS